MKKGYLIILFVLSATISFGQGKIMLVGGGPERDGGWSDAPYTWAITESANQRVAIVSTQDETEDLPDYFLSLGAAAADNIKIDSREVADQQATYDDLMSYDVFFFKGGDQFDYYNFYRGTLTEQAIEDKFAADGVISGTSAGMAMISKVMFTAENGTVFPDEVLGDVFNNRMRLADDFLDIMPGFIVDTHFVERGRFPRLVGFMANWQLTTGESVNGIGVDDQTAFCIKEGAGIVYGTAAINVFKATDFTEVEGQVAVENIEVVSAVHGQQIDLTTLTATDYTETSTAGSQSEDGNHTIIISGDVSAETNEALVASLVTEFGNASDQVLIVTSEESSITGFETLIGSLGTSFSHFIIDSGAGSSSTVASQIENANKFLFVGNNRDEAATFFASANGNLLKEQLRKPTSVSAFAGIDGDLASPSFFTNMESDDAAAFAGRADLKAGLGVLSTTMIVSNAFSEEHNNGIFENKSALLPYGMFTDDIRYGLWVNPNTIAKVYTESGQRKLVTSGGAPAMLLENNNGSFRFTDQLEPPRNVVGMTDVLLSFLQEGAQRVIGVSAGDPCEGVEVRASFNLVPSVGIAQTGETVYFFDFSRNAASLSWDFGNGETSTDLEPTTVYREAGEYTVSLTATGECGTDTFTRTITIEGDTVLGLPSTREVGITVYPNPTAEAVTIAWKNERFSITILDLQGKVQHQSNITNRSTLDIKGFSSGLYLLKISSASSGATYQQKLLVK